LLLVARRAERLETLAKQLHERYGVTVDVEVADLGQSADRARVATRIGEDEQVTLLVNNAGILKPVGVGAGTAADAHEVVAINVGAVTELTLAVLPGFVKRDRGTIVNVASVLALEALPSGSVYTGPKAYVLAFSRALQGELAGKNVHIQVVLPAATRTEFWTEESLKRIDTSNLMEVDALVDAALVGLDRQEAVTIPPLHDSELWTAFDQARMQLFSNSMSGTPGVRYLTGAAAAR
jgi:short-subunit dehydrogenase